MSSSIRISGAIVVALLLPACGVGGGGTLTPTVAPAIPSNVEALSGNERVTITWSSLSVGATYTVLRSLTHGGPYFPVSVPSQFAAPTIYVDAGLPNGTDFYYVVRASNRFGESAASNEAKGTPGFKPLAMAKGPCAQHNLALFQDGTVWAWGTNPYGALGNGAFSGGSFVPVPVQNLRNVTAIAAGGFHSLALKNDGTVWAWGYNAGGPLGQGTTDLEPHPLPLQVQNFTGASAIAAGTNHSLGLKNDGTVWAWGSNYQGALGRDPVDPHATTPVQVPGLTDVTAIAAGDSTSYALKSDGTVWAWGRNDLGQRGNGSGFIPQDYSPTQVDNLTGIVEIAAGGNHALALRSDGRVSAWGSNDAGQAGFTPPGGFLTRAIPVANLTGITTIAAGFHHSLAVKNDGTIWAWGDDQNLGVLGTGTTMVNSSTPVKVTSLGRAKEVSGGYRHSGALEEDGSAWTWGGNPVGELGVGTGSVRLAPATVEDFTGAVSIAAGNGHSHAAKADGTVWTWSLNTIGQFGNGAISAAKSPPTKANAVTGAVAVSAGVQHSLALTTTGTVWGWGQNPASETGDPNASTTQVLTPIQVQGLSSVTAVSAGYSCSLVRRFDGTVWAWGDNTNQHLGLGIATNPVRTPMQIPGLSGILVISGQGLTAFAVNGLGDLWGWGYNNYGQIGNGVTGNPVTTPIPVLTGVASVSSGMHHTLAVRTDGTVWAWGRNERGQLGSDSMGAPVPTPAPVQNLTGVIAVAAGNQFSLALRNDGTVWAWGDNDYGQLGDGTQTSGAVPVQAVGVTGATAISAGAFHSMARMPNGSILAWGNNNSQELGTPILPNSAVPMLIGH